MRNRAAIIIVQDDNVLLVRRRRAQRDYYVLPGGGVESSETPEEACVREALEETGLTITIKAKLVTLDNEGRLEHYFLAGTHHGAMRVGGPERDREANDNQYGLRWIDLGGLRTIALLPDAIRQTCVDCILSECTSDSTG